MIKRTKVKEIFLSDFFFSCSSVLIGLFIGFLIMLLTNPAQSIAGILTILFSPMINLRDIEQVLNIAPSIILTGLSVCFANKIGLFNIGSSGQFILGAYFAVWCGVKINFINNSLHFVLAILLSIIFGAFCGSIPGILKAFYNVNEVISSIMINYISMYLVNFMIKKNIFDVTKNHSKKILDSAVTPKLMIDNFFFGSSVNLNIFISIVAAVVIYIILEKTLFGFEIKTCGFNHYVARYIGINEKKILILTMTISGALSGLGGGLLYLSNTGNNLQVIDSLAQEGFTGISVALLASNDPIVIIFSGLFIAYLIVGGFNTQIYNFAPQLIEIITAIIIYSSTFIFLIKKYFSKNKK
ncbi:MAG: ABC transporter permease [Clostridiales bacterium]|nr:ABC transporter permease [Clostridiales bacterium]